MKIVAVGSGAAIAMAEEGNADVLLVHSPAAELAFMKAGYGTFRVPFAYNYFTIVGPKSDPAKVSGAKTAAQAFKLIAAYGETLPAGKVAFVSRGDQVRHQHQGARPGAAAGVTPSATPTPTPAPEPTGSWYIKTGQGMAATLQVASQKQAYTLTDTATYLADKSNLDLVPLLTKSADLQNLYDVILLNQAKYSAINTAGAEDLASWLTGPVGQKRSPRTAREVRAGAVLPELPGAAGDAPEVGRGRAERRGGAAERIRRAADRLRSPGC